MGFNFLKALEPLRGDSLLFTTKSQEVPGTRLIDIGRILESTMEPPSGFEPGTPGFKIKYVNV